MEGDAVSLTVLPSGVTAPTPPTWEADVTLAFFENLSTLGFKKVPV